MIYLLIINVFSFIVYGVDKYRSVKHMYRISENELLILALLGGVFGAFFGMIVFHHKTHKRKFVVFIPLIMLLWVYILIKF